MVPGPRRRAQQPAGRAAAPAAATGSRAALVLADRKQIIARTIEQAYPITRKSRVTYSGSGYGAGFAKGEQADLGGARLHARPHRALSGGNQ